MKHFKFRKHVHNMLWMFVLLANGILLGQNDPSAFTCGTELGAGGVQSTTPNCGHTSLYWSDNTKYLPDLSFNTMKVRVNLIILQRQDGSGNFQNNTADLALLNRIINITNETFADLTNRNEEYFPGQNLPFLSNAKIEIVPNIIFRIDETGWNNRNDTNGSGVPYLSGWYLDALDSEYYNDPAMPKAINLYFTNDGHLHQQMVVLGTTTDYTNNVFFKQHSASEIPQIAPDGGVHSNYNDLHTMRCHIANVWLKLWWQRNVNNNPDWITEYEVGESIAHELGHLMGLQHTSQLHSIMRSQFGGLRDYMTTREIGKMHQAFGVYPSLWQFVDCDGNYVSPTAERIVTNNETWDLKMRLYTNVVVKTGATLTITCEILMPFDGTITVERGSKLIINGGTVKRANTCTPAQFWRGIVVKGNNSMAQPNPGGIPLATQAGVVLLNGYGEIEGAVTGVAAKGHPIWDVPEFRGALIQSTNFTFRDCRKGVEFMKYDLVNFSKFDNVLFERTATGSMHTGVSIWDTDGILFDSCTFKNVALNGIVSWDAVFNVRLKNKFVGAEIGILAGASTPLNGQIQVGVLGQEGNKRNKFENNTVGIRATANSKVEIFSNDFMDFDFDVAINGTTQSAITDNFFAAETAGNQFESTGDNSNQTLCNRYQSNIVGTNIVGKNTGFLFRQEDFTTNFHDLFIEGTQANPGAIQMLQGNNGFARWNSFSTGKLENIKTSTVLPNNNTAQFFYFHPNPSIDIRLKPKCALNDACALQSNFTNIQTGGGAFSDCMFPTPIQEPCRTKPCLDAVRLQIAQKTAEYSANPTTGLAGELQILVTQREYITSDLVRDYMSVNNWTAVEALLNEDMNPANRRRMVGAKLEQKQFVAANALLQSFTQTTLDDQYFVQVQSINASRLSNSSFVLSSTQEATLLGIAESSSQEAGYAQSILGILTGRVFMPKLPDIGGDRSSMPSGQPVLFGGLQVSPNPVNDLLQVRVSQRVGKSANQVLELRDMTTGILVQSVSLPDGNTVLIDVQALPSGLYLLTLQEQGIAVAHQKVVVQH